MPYQFQQTPKILDTKMQASVATALRLLLLLFPPDYQNFNPPASFKILPLFLLLICPGQFIKQIDPAKQQLLVLLPSWSSEN